ncbi:GAF domain-containing protein [Antricoccus suffuscus]|uniref:GAF domain-containing protein n=1 Tax=Antricoccus suffuscus TaxID=1629062 RepID=A0A2T1A5R5_9ACTN|nr:GAF and ANTAR domain-containing protein [Antricoccus suffuscus]PRZ43904.1 GAF domain-containing protein [Antricoccus suffuscus]
MDNEPRTTPSAFLELSNLVYGSDTYEEIYQAVCDAAPRLVTGCDHASLMLRQQERLITAASSDDVARLVDEMEREIGAGPCVDAIVDDAPQIDADLTQSQVWPLLSARVLERTPVRGMAGFRVLVDNRKVGALNLFSDTPHALTAQSVNEAAVLAAFTSVALIAASRNEAANTLRAGLTSNREIGKAIGLLMAFHKISDDDAFEMLRRTSQDLNIKLTQVAAEVVNNHRAAPARGQDPSVGKDPAARPV